MGGNAVTRVKICGITNVEDALAAVEAGADYMGLVFAESPRQVTLARAEAIVRALPAASVTVGVFMDQNPAYVQRVITRVGTDMIQLHGDESWKVCGSVGRNVIKRFPVMPKDRHEVLLERTRAYAGICTWAFLFDPGAGGGAVFAWELVRGFEEKPVFIAGGLTPENVKDAIRRARPYGVDVSSGVESEPGKKDHAKMRDFVQAVREADREIEGSRGAAGE